MTPERLEELRVAYANLDRRFVSPPEADVLDLLDHVAEMESRVAKAKAAALRAAAKGVGTPGGNIVYPVQLDNAGEAEEVRHYLRFLADDLDPTGE